MQRVAEFLGGPVDGEAVALLPGARDGCIQTVRAPFSFPDGRGTYAVYRLTEVPQSVPGLSAFRFVHVGVTDVDAPMVERPAQCMACSAETLAIMPERIDHPLMCVACGRQAVWPKK